MKADTSMRHANPSRAYESRYAPLPLGATFMCFEDKDGPDCVAELGETWTVVNYLGLASDDDPPEVKAQATDEDVDYHLYLFMVRYPYDQKVMIVNIVQQVGAHWSEYFKDFERTV